MRRINPMEAGKYFAVAIEVPSPLVGEGIPSGRPGLGWVRGTSSQNAVLRHPLARLRFAKPPSPTRGEEKNPATPVCTAT